MNAPTIRIECRFCNHGFTVDARFAGQRIKCPKCKNPIQVPDPSAAKQGHKHARPAGDGRGNQAVRDRPIAVRRRGIPIGRIIKIGLGTMVLLALFMGYRTFMGQKDKPVGALMGDIASPETSDATKEITRQLILQKVGPEDLEVAELYTRHEDPAVREFSAKVLGKIGLAKAHDPLSRLAKRDDETSVRKAAVSALGEIRTIESIETLVVICSDQDQNNDIRGDAMGSLRKLTGQKWSNYSEWKEWWASSRSSFKLKNGAE